MCMHSALREERRRAKSERTMVVDRDVTVTASLGGDETNNPFTSDMLDPATVEMYRDLLNRPLPRLPKLYTLPSRLLEFAAFCLCPTVCLSSSYFFIVSEMTYTVSSGTLNSTMPYHTLLFHLFFNRPVFLCPYAQPSVTGKTSRWLLVTRAL